MRSNFKLQRRIGIPPSARACARARDFKRQGDDILPASRLLCRRRWPSRNELLNYVTACRRGRARLTVVRPLESAN